MALVADSKFPSCFALLLLIQWGENDHPPLSLPPMDMPMTNHVVYLDLVDDLDPKHEEVRGETLTLD